jgi:hypothetical protein
MRFHLLAAGISLLLAACTADRVEFNTPTTPPESGFVSDDTPAPTSANTVDPVPTNLIESDTTWRPNWLKARIATILAERLRNPRTRILKYEYDGQTVYWESAPCCDQYSILYDTKGKVVCNPDGGITGKGDGKCADFNKNKTNEKMVWQDPR